MGEQAGLIYKVLQQFIAKPNTSEGLRLFVNALDNLAYVKKPDGTIELFSDFLGATGDQSLTYAQLIAKIGGSTLITGANYLITDFRTRYIIPNTAVTVDGTIEPIIITAASVNSIAPFAISSVNPQDEILYEVVDSTTAGGDRGRIYYRKDTTINVASGYNWREIKFRRWETAPASGIFTVTTNNGNAFQDFYTFNDSAVALDCKETYVGAITEFGINTFAAPSSKLNNNIFNAVCYDNKIDCDSFDNTINVTTFGGNVILPAFIQNIFTGGEVVLNNFSAAFVNNTIGADFQDNRVGLQFAGNNILDNFSENNIGDNFFFNIIQNGFVRNTIASGFGSNQIDNDFADNNINSEMQGNIISDNFSVNQIENKFQNNTIESDFVSNIIGGDFVSNINIHDGFKYNTITQGLNGVDFNAATHVYNDYTKTIFKNSAGTYRLSYIDGADTIIYTIPNA